MDINATSFPGTLLDILVAISESCFVSFDLELSGIPSKQIGRTDKKQTLQERYAEIKQAAERYQILQIGLTCGREFSRPASPTGSQETEIAYGLHPYNFSLSPLILERLDLERIFSFQSGAAQFLVEHGFQIDLPFTKGVPYLSRNEAKSVKEREYAKLRKRAVVDIDLSKPEDAAAVEFMDDVRDAIKNWQKRGKSDSLDIDPTIRNVPDEDRQRELSKFEMRLVHQLIRTDFPHLQSLGKGTYVKIIQLDEEREEAHLKEKKRKIKERIINQTGFRWIIELMCGGDLSDVDPKMFARNRVTGESAYADLDYLRSRWSRAQDKMTGRRPVLVGHNLFIDLIYLYHTFIGPLPETVEEHATNIHKLFPRVIDTKFMATQNSGRIKPDSSLDGLEDSLPKQTYPIMLISPVHDKYSNAIAYHEAGYDSLVTARVFIRLSARLEALGSYDSLETIEGPETTQGNTDTVAGKNENGSDDAYETAKEESSIAGLLSHAVSSVKTGLFGTEKEDASSAKGSKKKKKNKKKTKKKSTEPVVSRFAQRNVYDALQKIPGNFQSSEDEDEVVPDTSFEKDIKIAAPSNAISDVEPIVENAYPKASGNTKKRFVPAQMSNRKIELPKTMPSWDSDFWRVYVNKLRVFGTKEEVCVLDGK